MLEVSALRHQIAVMERSNNRPRFSAADRLFWIVLSGCWSRWSEALEIIEPETVLRWRRAGRRPRWVWAWPRHRLGRPPIDRDTRQLIRRMSLDNFLWGAPRIHGELRMLGIRVAQSTVAKYMIRRPEPPSPTWRTFLRIHRRELIATRGMSGGSHQLTYVEHLVLSLVSCSLWGGPTQNHHFLDSRGHTCRHSRVDTLISRFTQRELTAIPILLTARSRGPPSRTPMTALVKSPLAVRDRNRSWCVGNSPANVPRFCRHPCRPTSRVVQQHRLVGGR